MSKKIDEAKIRDELDLSVGDEEILSKHEIWEGIATFTYNDKEYNVEYEKEVDWHKQTGGACSCIKWISKPKDINDKVWEIILEAIEEEIR